MREFCKDQERYDATYDMHYGVYLDFTWQRASMETMELLCKLVKKQNLEGRINEVVTDEKLNLQKNKLDHTWRSNVTSLKQIRS